MQAEVRVTKSLEKFLTALVHVTSENICANTLHTKQSAKPEVAVAQENDNCTHCFQCGKDGGHRAVGCLLKTVRETT